MDVPNFLKDVPNLLKDIPKGFQSPFQDGERISMTSLGSSKDQMDHEKGYRGLGSPMIIYTKFS